MSFNSKKIWNIKEIKSYSDFYVSLVSVKFFTKLAVLLVFIFFIGWFWTILYSYAIETAKEIWKITLNMASENLWEEMEKDEFWQINVLLAWYWWDEHMWGYLTDTIMIASYDIKLWTVSFLSIPRDLYVKYSDWLEWRINNLFSREYYKEDKNKDKAANKLIKKINEITWVEINYYALVDFNWFEEMIDNLWWIEIDVPEKLYDYQYPTENWWYTAFKVEQWLQTFDWATALKYARSRHSTSDFSRALRQQQIIKAIIKKVIKAENILDINKIQELYGYYNQIIHTNIWLKKILWMLKYKDNINQFFTFVYTADCNKTHHSVMTNWCFLYYPPREQFWWNAIILPEWAYAWNISNYKSMQDFAFFVIYNQKFLLENALINIKNWIDISLIKKKFRFDKPIANELAVDLKNYWFNIWEVGNIEWDEYFEDNTVYVNWTWDYQNTINLLKIFMEVDQVMTWDIKYWDWLTLVLWSNYIE